MFKEVNNMARTLGSKDGAGKGRGLVSEAKGRKG